jgi:hypothetical protein
LPPDGVVPLPPRPPAAVPPLALPPEPGDTPPDPGAPPDEVAPPLLEVPPDAVVPPLAVTPPDDVVPPLAVPPLAVPPLDVTPPEAVVPPEELAPPLPEEPPEEVLPPLPWEPPDEVPPLPGVLPSEVQEATRSKVPSVPCRRCAFMEPPSVRLEGDAAVSGNLITCALASGARRDKQLPAGRRRSRQGASVACSHRSRGWARSKRRVPMRADRPGTGAFDFWIDDLSFQLCRRQPRPSDIYSRARQNRRAKEIR